MHNKVNNRLSFVIKFLFISISYLFFGNVFAETTTPQSNVTANTVATSAVSNLSPADALLLKQAQEETARDKAAKAQQQVQEMPPQGLVTAPTTLQSAPISSNLEQSSKPVDQQPLAPREETLSPNLRITTTPQTQLDLTKEDAKIQVTEERLAAVEVSISTLQKQFTILTQYMEGLNLRINKLQQDLQKLEIQSQTAAAIKKEEPKSLVKYFFVELWPKPYVKMGFLSLCIVIVLIFWLLFRHSKKHVVKQHLPQQDDTASEYDFMEGEQGIDARLNLARAYIAMDKKQEANNLLEEILVKGDERQRQEASDLIRKIS